MKEIAIGSDHAGFELKTTLIEKLKVVGFTCIDKGTFSSERADYPDFGHAVASEVIKEKAGMGIVICGTANGIAMSANKHNGIRCAVCWTAEISELARAHNDANVLALPVRFISTDEAWEIVNAFLSTSFEGGRHASRVAKIAL